MRMFFFLGFLFAPLVAPIVQALNPTQGPETQEKYLAVLSDGKEIEVSAFKRVGQYIYLTLPNGSMVGYAVGDVRLESLQVTSGGEVGSPAESVETGNSESTMSSPRQASRLSEAAGAIKLPDTSDQPISIVGKSGDDSVDSRETYPAGAAVGSSPPSYLDTLIERGAAEHAAALLDYSTRLADLAGVRDELVAMDYRAAQACEGFTPVIGVVDLSNEYGGFWSGSFSWGALVFNSFTPYCRGLLADCDRLSRQLNRGLDDLAEFARRSGVTPGEARSLLSQYALNKR